MNSYVLDASAVLAYINAEPGSEMVEEVLFSSTISSANLTEVFSKLVRSGMDAEETRDVLLQCCPSVTAVDREQAETAGIIHAAVTHLGISYADCACLSLGARCDRPVLTADHKWEELDIDFDVEVSLIGEKAD